MRNDRLARALLRLYPRAWRERYGDEFLGLIDETGLTSRSAANIVAGAVTQRARLLLAWRTRETDPAVAIHVFASLTAREALIEWPTFCALFAGTVVGLHWLGVPLPLWAWWMQALMQYFLVRSDFVGPVTTPLRRAGIGYYFALEAMALASAAFLSGRLLIAIGLPEPTSDAFLFVPLLAFVTLAVRVGWCAMRSNQPHSEWPGARSWEVRLWRVVGITLFVAVSLGDSDMKTIWGMTTTIFLCRPIMNRLSRTSVARRREAIARLRKARVTP
ncbi:MAG TPA: hypothetical protein VFV98_11170 [Vicinamibacterales bacterium]|nr:hypothetical protein [Vicinamibacterales bacterium]